MEIITALLQAVALLLMVVTVIYMQEQINEMRNIERRKKIIAIHSLLHELRINKGIISEYIQHYKIGNNSGRNKVYSWELVAPRFENYQNLALACESDPNLANQITRIYTDLEACKVIVNFNLTLLGNNLVTRKSKFKTAQSLKDAIVKNNTQLNEISMKLVGLLEESIKKLEVIREVELNKVKFRNFIYRLLNKFWNFVNRPMVVAIVSVFVLSGLISHYAMINVHKKTSLWFPYAYEYDYRKSTNEAGNRFREIVENEPIVINVNKDKTFWFSIANKNHRSLKGVSLTLILPQGIEVNYPESQGWLEYQPNEEYSFHFEHDIHHGMGENTGPIILKGVKKGELRIRYYISGEDIQRNDKSFIISIQ